MEKMKMKEKYEISKKSESIVDLCEEAKRIPMAKAVYVVGGMLSLAKSKSFKEAMEEC